MKRRLHAPSSRRRSRRKEFNTSTWSETAKWCSCGRQVFSISFAFHSVPSPQSSSRISITDSCTRLSCPIYKGKRKTLCPPNPSHFPASPPERWRLHLYARTRVRVGLSTRRYGVFLLSSRRSFVLRRLLSRIRRAKPSRIW